ncbi:MAG: hypothetical protein ABFR63_05000 [Thermodesulfobacteriota bacterium]
MISLVKSVRTRAAAERESYLIFYDSAERKLWYRPAEEKESTEARGSVTLPGDIHIQQIKQRSGEKGQTAMDSGIWVSRRGYTDKTVIELVDGKGDKSLSLLISPFLPSISVSEEPIDLQ